MPFTLTEVPPSCIAAAAARTKSWLRVFEPKMEARDTCGKRWALRPVCGKPEGVRGKDSSRVAGGVHDAASANHRLLSPC